MENGSLGKLLSKKRRQRASALRLDPVITPRSRKRVVAPHEREWATAYLKHVAGTLGYLDVTIREAIPLLERHFEITMPQADGAARRSSVAIAMAKAVQEKSGIALPKF